MYSINDSYQLSRSVRQGKHSAPYHRHRPREQQQIDQLIMYRLRREHLKPTNTFLQFINVVRQEFDITTIALAVHYFDTLEALRFRQTGQPIFTTSEELVVCAFVIADYFINDKVYIRAVVRKHNLNLTILNEKLNYVISEFGDKLYCSAEQFNLIKGQIM